MCFAEGDNTAAGAVAAKIVYRKDYTKPHFTITDVDINFELDAAKTKVSNTMLICARSAEAASMDLVLDGDAIELIHIEVAGRRLEENNDYSLGEKLTIFNRALPTHKIMKPFEVKILNYNFPEANSELSGLYKSKNLLCTQCEAEGFRRITYFIDRPDVMCKYRVRIEADRTLYPVLLSNGDCVRQELDLPNNKHSATFIDPFKKPCYLFALVAGQLSCISNVFTTMEGSEVDVQVYAEEKYIPQCHWALECTLRAMKWDEEKYGRCYDLSTFRVVCIEDFNAGAMENKSLTTYNVACVLASKDTAPDGRFQRVLSVIGHEYFHNWSGDRVTLRDWFQISVKEGFTSMRESSFAEDEGSRAVERISNVRVLRAVQFPEDAGPMAHPVRPESYQSIDNFYTYTVYEKGAEVIRMMQRLVGADEFRKGAEHYFAKFDGEAISCDDFREAIAEATGRNLDQFERWYSQKGTPVLNIDKREYNAEKKTYTLTIRQIVPEQDEKQPGKCYQMPVYFGLVGRESHEDLIGTKVLELVDEVQTWTFENIKEDCVPSVLRDFSAPVKVNPHLEFDEIAILMAYDADPVKRWDALQSVYKHYLLEMANKIVDKSLNPDEFDCSTHVPPEHIKNGISHALNSLRNCQSPDYHYCALYLTLPDVTTLYEDMKPHADPLALKLASRIMDLSIAHYFCKEFQELFDTLYSISKSKEWAITAEDCGRRCLQNACLRYLTLRHKFVTKPEDGEQYTNLLKYFRDADSYNDKAAAFAHSLTAAHPNEIVTEMYEICKADPNMLMDWLRSQVLSVKTFEEYQRILEHPDYKANKDSPNCMRSVVSAFSYNFDLFHESSGRGYELFADLLLANDKINAYTTAGATKSLLEYTYFSPDRKKLMQKALKKMQEAGVSKATAEVVERGLHGYD